MVDNYNGIINIEDNGTSGEEQKVYTKIFGYVIDENYNPVYSKAGSEIPIVVKINDLEYNLGTDSNYFEFSEEEVSTLKEGMITVFDGDENTIFNWNDASHAFTGAAKTRLNIKIKMPYKRINMGDVGPEEMNSRPININITNGEEVAQRLNITAKDGNENDIDDFSESLSVNGNTITCTIQYGYMIKFVDPNNEFYDNILVINTPGENTYDVTLVPKTPEVYILINVHIYDKDSKEDITSSSWVSIDEEDKPIGESTFNVTQYSTIIANNSEYLADYKIIESTTSPQDITFELKKQPTNSSGGTTDEEWHEVYLGMPWYVDKIDLKYNAVDIYSSKKAQLTHEKINILPFTDTNCVGSYDGNVVLNGGTIRNSKLNNLNYTRNVNINENIYQFLFELKKEKYPIDFLETADKDTKTLELHTFEPTPIKVKQRKMNDGKPEYIKYNPKEGEGDSYIISGATNIIGGFIDVTYKGESGRKTANNIISAQYISGEDKPWNTIGLTSNQTISLNNVYLQPVINTENTTIDNIKIEEKQEHINILSILYDNIICHSESYTFPYLPDGSSLSYVDLIYGQKNKSINVGPLKYKFKQDDKESTVYSLQGAANEKYIPKFKIDDIKLGDTTWDKNNYTTEINNEYLKINKTDPIILDNDSTLKISYHMNDDIHTENQVISVSCYVVSYPEVILNGYTFNNVDNYNFKYITDADVSVTENYFKGATDTNVASKYSFILYSKSPGNTPENLLTTTIESQTGDISENELTVHNNVSLSASDGSDIKYTLTSLAGTGSWENYNSTINSTYNILGTYYTKSDASSLQTKTKISYSYINDIIVNDNLSCSYKLNNNEYIYNVKATDDKYNGKYYLYNNEAFSELSIFERWKEDSNNYTYSTTSGLPESTNIIKVQYTENDIKSLTASMYNLLTDGTMFVTPNITTNNKVILLTDADNNNELLKQQNIINDIKGQMHAALGHNYIVQTNDAGTNYTNTFLYTTLSSSNSSLYVGPTFNKETGSNKFKINYSNFTSNETLTSEINNTLIKRLAIVSSEEQGDDYINNHKYDWYNFDTQTVSEDVSNKYYDLFKSENLSYNSLTSNSMPKNIKDYYENYIYKYDKEKYGEETSTEEYYNHSFVIYTESSQSSYNNFKDYVNTYTADQTWCNSVGYTVAKSYILGFTYSYIYNSIVKYGNSDTENYYKVGPINLTNTELYSYNIGNNNTVNIITMPGITYSGLLATSGRNIADGIEIFKSSSNLVEKELSDFTEYNNIILSYINTAFTYTYDGNNNAITLEQMYNLFGNTSINITTTNNKIKNDLKEYLELDKRLNTFKLKFKSDNGNYNDYIIDYALCMKTLYYDFIPKLANGIKKYSLNKTISPGEVHYTNPEGITLDNIKAYIRENATTNNYYYWKISDNTYSALIYWTYSESGEEEGAVSTIKEYYGYNQNGVNHEVKLTKVSQVYIKTADSQIPEYSIGEPAVINLQAQKCTNLFTLFDLWDLSKHDYKIEYGDIIKNPILSSLLADMGITLTGEGKVHEYITFESVLYEKYIQNKTLFNIANQQSNSYDTSKQNIYCESIIYKIPYLEGNSTDGYTINTITSIKTVTQEYLVNGLLYGLAELCYNLINLAIQAFDTYKQNINNIQQEFDVKRTNILTRIKNNTPESVKYLVIKSFDTIAYIDDEKPGITKFYDVYNEIKYLEEYGQKLMIINYLKRALAFAKGKGEEMSNYLNQLSIEITKEKILSEINFVNRWITSRLLSYRKNSNTDRIQWGTGNSILTFNPEWINLISDNEYSVNTIYCNGYNIYKLNNDIYENENITQYPGLHLRYVINESISEITANTDVYSMTDIKKFRGTIYQTCEDLKKRTNNVLHLLLYYYDGFIKEIKVTNNILNNAYKVNNIGCVYEEVNDNLLITFDATEISEDNIDTNKFRPSIEIQYCHTGESIYTETTVVNNNGFYVNIPLSGNKLCHIRYRMKWSSSTGISIYSGYKNIVYFYNPNNDGYSYKSLEFDITNHKFNSLTTNDINSILNNALELQLFAKRFNSDNSSYTYYVADYRSSISNKNIGFKFIKTVNGTDQIVAPKLSKNYTNYSLSIIDLGNGNLGDGDLVIGGGDIQLLPISKIITNKKYVLTKG